MIGKGTEKCESGERESRVRCILFPVQSLFYHALASMASLFRYKLDLTQFQQPTQPAYMYMILLLFYRNSTGED
jgi:hypothetical protein